MCLKCCEIYCGRYGAAHMIDHWHDDEEHCIALGIGDLSFWCYQCDSYLHHLTIRSIFEVYKVAHQKKFGEEIPRDLAAQTRFHEHDTFMEYLGMDSIAETSEDEDDDDDSDDDDADDGDDEKKKEEELSSLVVPFHYLFFSFSVCSLKI